MIGLIGYRNHSLKILNILVKYNYKNIIVYCRDKKKLLNVKKNILYTDDINELIKCSIIFICSPNNTHYKYIKKFLSKDTYIFCEKPASVCLKEVKKLKNLKNQLKEKIYFNFNYIKSNTYYFIDKEIKNKQNGELMHVSIYATHGLFFKNKFNKNWRIQNKNIFEEITGNLGIHYINLLNHLFGKIKIINKNTNRFSKKGTDSSLITIRSSKGKTASIYLSYATVFSQEIKIFFTNSILEISSNNIYKYSPRDTFDSKGRFIKPRKKLIKKNSDISKLSLEESVKFFMNVAYSKKKFNIDDYNLALNSSIIILKNNS